MLFVFSPYRSLPTSSSNRDRDNKGHRQVQSLTLKVPFMVTEVCQVAMAPELWPRLTSQVPCLPAVRMTLPYWCQALTESPHRLAQWFQNVVLFQNVRSFSKCGECVFIFKMWKLCERFREVFFHLSEKHNCKQKLADFTKICTVTSKSFTDKVVLITMKYI